jgi:hypothetical protein
LIKISILYIEESYGKEKETWINSG